MLAEQLHSKSVIMTQAQKLLEGEVQNKLWTAIFVVLSVGILSAQTNGDLKALVGGWTYRLGPRALFGLHLELSKDAGGGFQGYVITPEHYSMNIPVRFSGIKGSDRNERVISTGRKDGLLLLKEENASAKPEQLDVFSVRSLDANHIAFTLFQQLPPLTMEKTTDKIELFHGWDSTQSYSPGEFLPDNAVMTLVVAADQADRKNYPQIDWKKVNHADAERRKSTLDLLQQGALNTGKDFENAALVYQHGDTPSDYLLAHALATVALSKGQADAVWLSAATLDRYLWSIQHSQVFGTQFKTPEGKLTTQEPYERAVVSDALRKYLAVPIQAEQEAQKKHYDIERGLPADSK